MSLEKEHIFSFHGFRGQLCMTSDQGHEMCLLSLAAKVQLIIIWWTTVFNIFFCIFMATDLQNVNITLRILFRPIPTSLPNIYSTLGVDYDERVLPSITNEILKAVVVSSIFHSHIIRPLKQSSPYFRPNLMLVNWSHNVKMFPEKSVKLLLNVLASLVSS